MTGTIPGKKTMAALDILALIEDNVDLTPAQKLGMLNDFCAWYDFEGTIAEKKTFVNEQIHALLKTAVNGQRRREEEEEITIEELELEQT